jgi:Ca2+-binding EF-hand superfamily protein
MTTKQSLIAAAIALAFASSAFAQGSSQPPRKSTSSTAAKPATFKGLDKNRDGYIERSEASGALAGMFGDLDTNKDGKLSSSEYAKHERHK